MDAAGIYITEHYAECIVGEIFGNGATFLGAPMPSTKNDRTPTRIKKGNLTPQEFLTKCADWVNKNSTNLKSIAVSCFGPFQSLDNSLIHPDVYAEYGVLGDVPTYDKGWARLHIYHIFKGLLCNNRGKEAPLLRVYTDVDAAAYGEYLFRAKGLKNIPRHLSSSSVAFLKFSRSINGGIAFDGDIWRGRLHPLMSIISPRRFQMTDTQGNLLVDQFSGSCPYHSDCIEGLIGLEALEQRTGSKFDDILDNDPVWEIVAYYAATLCVSVTGILAPSHIVLGGRIIKDISNQTAAEALLHRIRYYFYQHITSSTGHLSPHYSELADKDNFIVLPARAKMRDGSMRAGMPGLHGTLRLAVNEFHKCKGTVNE